LAIKMVVIGANPANAEELKTVVSATVGGSAEIINATLENYRQIKDADIYLNASIITYMVKVITSNGAPFAIHCRNLGMKI